MIVKIKFFIGLLLLVSMVLSFVLLLESPIYVDIDAVVAGHPVFETILYYIEGPLLWLGGFWIILFVVNIYGLVLFLGLTILDLFIWILGKFDKSALHRFMLVTVIVDLVNLLTFIILSNAGHCLGGTCF